MADPSPIKTLLDAPEHLLATHDRLRCSGFPVVSLINASTSLEARLWLFQWARARGRPIFISPVTEPGTVLAAYRARMPTGCADPGHPAEQGIRPVVVIPGNIHQALASSVALSAQIPRLSVALVSGIAGVIESLLDPQVPRDLVAAALQGLVPVEDTARQVLHTVATRRDMQPFLRGPCEGLLYYMLEARPETRGRFSANLRLGGASGNRTHEVDLGSAEARLVIEIDGPEHDSHRRKRMDARKQQDLESQGYRVCRFSNDEVRERPVDVWRLIAAQLKKIADNREKI